MWGMVEEWSTQRRWKARREGGPGFPKEWIVPSVFPSSADRGGVREQSLRP